MSLVTAPCGDPDGVRRALKHDSNHKTDGPRNEHDAAGRQGHAHGKHTEPTGILPTSRDLHTKTVATGVRGIHFHRHHRYPGTHRWHSGQTPAQLLQESLEGLRRSEREPGWSCIPLARAGGKDFIATPGRCFPGREEGRTGRPYRGPGHW